MPIEYCDYCNRIIDLDKDVEHWTEEEYLKGRENWACTLEMEDIDFKPEPPDSPASPSGAE